MYFGLKKNSFPPTTKKQHAWCKTKNYDKICYKTAAIIVNNIHTHK